MLRSCFGSRRSRVRITPPRLESGTDAGEAYTARYTTPHEKPCTNCGVAKPLDAFNRKAAARDGRQSWCRECFSTLYRRDPDQREKAKARAARYRQQNPEKRKAHRLLNYAIESGQMTRGFCECCGAEKADAHHWKGYDRPLDVQWLCRSCHVTVEPRRVAA